MPSSEALEAYDAFRRQVHTNPDLIDAWGATGSVPHAPVRPGGVLTILERRGVGASNIAFHVIRGLRERGVAQVTLGHGDPGSIGALAPHETVDAAVAVPDARASWRALRARLEAVIDDVRPSVVVTHREFPWAWMLAEIAPSRSGLRTVVACNGGPLLFRVAGTPLERELGEMMSRADCVVALSKFVRRELVSRVGVPDDTIEVVRGGYDPEIFHPGGRVPGDGRLRVAYVGRLEPDKAPDRFVEAVRLAHGAGVPIEGVLVGDGAMAGELQAAAAAPTPLRIRATGSIDATGVADVLRSSDVLVVPSKTEGLGLQTLEALASGVAVVASRVGGLEELVGESGGGRLAGSTGEIAAILGELAGDAEQLRALQAAGPAYLAREDMRWSAVVDGWARVLARWGAGRGNRS